MMIFTISTLWTTLWLKSNLISGEIHSQSIFDQSPARNGFDNISKKTGFASKLLQNAKPYNKDKTLNDIDAVFKRNLEQEMDISGYEVMFEQCQFIKEYNDELAEDEESDTVLSIEKFVIFKLCPAGTCNGGCNYNFGEYIIDLNTYLESAVEYFAQWQEDMCEQCEEVCVNDDTTDSSNSGSQRRLNVNVDCDSCVNECAKIEAMEDNGFIEASNYMECQRIYEADDDSGTEYYAGSMCSSYGSKIKIGVFSDENCYNYEKDLDVEDYLGGPKLSHAILKKVYEQGNCVSCTELDWDVPEDDATSSSNNAEVRVTEMCEGIYEVAGKCESKYGFDNYWKDYEEYENQYEQEDLVCEFIDSIRSGAYDYSGEIVIQVRNIIFCHHTTCS